MTGPTAVAPATVSAAAPVPPATRRAAWWPAAAIGAVAAAGFALFLASLPGVNLAAMNGLGLISVLPGSALAGAALLAAAFAAALGLARPYPAVLGGMLAAITFCLDGVTTITESRPRFATAYQISGFVDYVSRTGHAAPGLQAYFSWPGFFALIAFLAGAAGQHDLTPIMRIWPVTIDLLSLPPLFLIMAGLRISWRARWLAAFLFATGNWIGQDYFSPQSFNYLLYLVFAAILVNWFTAVTPRPPAATGRTAITARTAATARTAVTALAGRWARLAGRRPATSTPGAASRLPVPRAAGPAAQQAARLWRRALRPPEPGEMPTGAAGAGQRAILLLLLVAIFTVATTSHQLTPFYLLALCAGLIVARRCTLTSLPLLLGAILAGWVSFATVAYWSGHMADVLGGLGRLGSNVTTSIGGRMAGNSQTHALVLHARVAVPAAIVILAGLGLLRRRLRGIEDRVVTVLLCMPLLSIGLQSYGGEIALRIFLFLLPAASILAACFFFPQTEQFPAGRPWRVIPAVAACAVALVLVFFVLRYGNEAFEQVPAGEVTAMDYVYAHDGQGVRLLWPSEAPATDNTPEMPWAYRDIAKVSYDPVLAPQNPAAAAGMAAILRSDGPGSYLIVTATQVNYLTQVAGYPAGWGQQFRTAMAAAPGVQVAFENPSSVIYTLRWPPGAVSATPAADVSGPSVRNISWTPAALAVLGLLITVLLGRELIGVCVPGARRLLRPLLWASAPLFVLLLGIVAARFVLLS